MRSKWALWRDSRGQAFSFHQTDPATGKRTARSIEADAGDKLKAAIEAALEQAG